MDCAYFGRRAVLALAGIAAAQLGASAWAAEPAAATRRVGLSGDAGRIQISGNRAFSDDAIRRALHGDYLYQAAARPSRDLETLTLAAQRSVTAGYRHAGYVNAKATAEFDEAGDCVALEIEEGRQYLTAGIEVVAANAIDGDELASRLQEPTPQRTWKYVRGTTPIFELLEGDHKEPAWEEGKPVEADEQSITRIARYVHRHLADMGWPFARLTGRIDVDHGQATGKLVVTIEDEGPRLTLNELRIEGLTRHTLADVQQFLQLQPGAPLTADAIDRVAAALRQSCRFWSSDVEVRMPDPKGNRYGPPALVADLEIRVVEYDLVAPLDESLAAEDECLRRAAAWLERFQQGETDDEFAIRMTREPGGELQAVLSPRRGAVVRVKSRGADDPYWLDAGVIHGPDVKEIHDWLTRQRLRTPEHWRPYLSLAVTPNDVQEGRFAAKTTIGCGFSSDTAPTRAVPSLWKVDVAPVALVHAAHRKDARATIDDGVLTVVDGALTMRFRQETGALIDLHTADGSSTFDLEVVRGHYENLRRTVETEAAELPQRFDSRAPWTSTAAFLARIVARQPCVANDAGAMSLCTSVVALLEGEDVEFELEGLMTAIGIRVMAAGVDEGRFPIPLLVTSSADLEFLGLGTQTLITAPRIADYAFPRGSAPWTLVREAGFFSVKPPLDKVFRGGMAVELTPIFATVDAGPITVLAAAKFLRGTLREDGLTTIFAAPSLATFDQRDVRRDAALLAVGDHGLAQLTRAAVTFIDLLDSDGRAAVLAAAPAEYRGVVAALLARRAGHPQESPEESVEAALVEAWNGGLREHVRAELERMARASEQPGARSAQQPAATATE